MTTAGIAPLLTPFKQIDKTLRDNDFAVVSAETVTEFSKTSLSSLQKLTSFWDDLPRDPYLKDGGRYCFRRHANYQIKGNELNLVPHRAHWQSLDYNALHGGIEHWFEPIQSELLNNPAWQSVLLGLAHILNGLKFVNTWFIE